MLDIDILKAELNKLFNPDNPGFVGYPADILNVAINWANAYDAYALSAQDQSKDSIISANKAGFQTGLESLPNANIGTAELSALAFETAFVNYWTGGVFAIGKLPEFGVGGTGIFSIETTSLVISVVPSMMYNQVLPVFSTIKPSLIDTVDAIAQAMHNATIGVIVTITGLDTSLPTPVPIVSVGNIS